MPWPVIWAAVRPFWKPVAIAVAIGAALWGFSVWKDRIIANAKAEQAEVDSEKYTKAVIAANKIAENDENAMKLMATVVGALTTQKTQAIDLKIAPLIERIQNEVASDPRYRECRVSDGVLNDANTARSTVDAGIAASNPKRD